MRCKNCGGQLRYQNGLYVCGNCNSSYDLTSVYENIDVFIAYVESDEQGKRTKDSVIAQELYKRLENEKISTFYQRISAGDLTGNDFDTACTSSVAQSKILLLLGTNRKHFEILTEQYRDLFSDKKIIPVYADMNANDLPAELVKLQAMNYNNIGSVSDMIKRILQLLGREEEIIFIETVHKHRSRKKKALFFSIISILVVVAMIGSYIVFGTTLVLPSKKYEAAQSLIENENYADAIDILTDLNDYKDSGNLIKGIYDRYEGYYQSEDETVGLHLIVSDDSVISVEITEKYTDKGIIKITENAEINKNITNFAFNDSQNQQGTAMVELTNEGINLNIQREQAESKTVFFQLNKKSDTPILEEITAATIKEWLLNGITESKLKANGYELIFENALYKDTAESQYEIKNTDIKVALYNHDISKPDNASINDRIAFGFSAPANILTPDKIGSSTTPYVENDILYVPNSVLSQTYYPIDFWTQKEIPLIENDTTISCTSRALIGEENWGNLLKAYVSPNKQ